MNEQKIMRPMLAHFLNTTPTASSPTFNRIGKGVTGYTINFNPNVANEHYIHEDNATNSVDAYGINAPIPVTCYKGDPVFDFLYGLYKASALGSDLATQVLDVSIFDGANGTYFAKMYNAVIQLDDFGGDAGAGTVMNATILYNGDPQTGTASIDSTTGNVTFNEGAVITSQPLTAKVAKAEIEK